MFYTKRKDTQISLIAAILTLTAFEVHRAGINCRVDMVRQVQEGKDIIYGVRKERKTDTFFKRFTEMCIRDSICLSLR